MTRLVASVAALLFGVLLACGKYGPPVRAGSEPSAKKPAAVIPVPVVPERETRPPPPPEAPAPEPEIEQEPPPEGAP